MGSAFFVPFTSHSKCWKLNEKDLLNGSSNEILDKIVACKSSSNNMINGDQFHEEIMQQMVSEALADGSVKLLGGASLEDVLGSLDAGRVRFVAVNDPSELDIK